MKKTALVLVLLLAGCTGQMTGMIRGSGERVIFEYAQKGGSDEYTTVISGEYFQGRAVMVDATSSYGTVYTSSGTSSTYEDTATGKVKAVLLGNRGSTLQCEMQYADQLGATNAGGVGECTHSDGRVIDVVW